MKRVLFPILLLATITCFGAPVTWTSGPTSVTDENDIDLTGTLVHAANYGSGAQSVVVGSETINFAAGSHLNDSDPPLAGDAIVSASGQTNPPDGFEPPGAIGADFHSVMDGFAYDGPNPKVLKLGNLTPGRDYQVQLFVADDRSCCFNRTQKWSDNATSGAGSETSTFTHGAAAHVIGEFTADSSEQVIYGHGANQSQTVLTAYIVREKTVLLPAAPTDLVLSNTSLISTLPIGSIVGTLSSVDPNSGDTHTYSLVDSGSFPANALFAVVNGNELRTAGALGSNGTTYQVKLRSTDNTSRSLDKVVQLSVDPLPPTINSLTALPHTIVPGGSSTIEWSVTNATSFTLNGSPVTGTSTVVSPLSTTTYILEASNGDGADGAEVTVTVANVPDFKPVDVRFVEVVKLNTADTRLHISEIEVFPFGTDPDHADADGTSRNDLVQGGFPSTVTPPTTTNLEHGNPNSVFDGDIEAGAAVWTTSDGLGVESRYMLDLGATYAIDKIHIWGRGDTCCTDRLQNFEVNVYADDGSGHPGDLVNSLHFPGAAPTGTAGPAVFGMAFPDPGIRSFTVDKPFIPQNEPITLSWEVHADVTSVVIDNGIGDVTALTDHTGAGSVLVNPGPDVNTTYGILVTKPSGASAASVSVEVTDQPLIYSLVADQTVVAPGATVQLSWSAGNHTELELNGVDVFGATGTTVNPVVTTDYTLTATNSNGTISGEIRLRVVVPGEPIISEFMADNRGDVTLDEDGDSSDWIEICNPTESAVSLHGYFLTDDASDPTKWPIPNVTVAPGGYLLVFASGKDRSDPLSELHASFLLQDAGEYLALVKPDGSTVIMEFWPAFPKQNPEVSYGFNGQFLQEGYFLAPTPGVENGSAFDGFVGDTVFSIDRGFYDSPISVEITTTIESDAEIRYTLDGTEPTESTGLVYNAPIAISGTTVLRAAGFKPGYVPTNVDTQTYIFTTDVVTQPNMLTSITQDPVYGPQMDASLKAVPSVSLVFQGDIERTEKECSVEFIGFEAGSTQFDVGMARFGNYVTNFPKRSMRLYFRSEYGLGKLRFPVFDGFDYDIPPAAEIDALDLRSGNHDMSQRGAYLSGRFADDTMIEMGNLAPHGRYVHVYVNGLYWGQYHLRERWDADMMAEYFPGKDEDYEAINANNTGGDFLEGAVVEGSGQYWNETKNLLDSPTPFTSAADHIDFANVIDFMLLWVSGNSESEFRAAGSVPMGVPFKFWMKDPDGFLRSPGHSAAHQGPLGVMSKLAAEGDPNFRILLADRIHKHFFNDGAFTPANNIARLQRRVDEASLSFFSEAARWNYRTPDSWQSFQDNLVNSHFPGLTQTMITRFRDAGMYPTVDAPGFNQHGGSVPSGFDLTMNAPAGTIYYTTDGSDPRASEVTTGGNTVVLVPEGAAKTVHVPQNATDGLTDGSGNPWDETGFNDSGWTAGTGGVGYEDNSGYENYFDIDVGAAMSDRRPSCLIRVPFTISPGGLADLNFLTLKMRYDDGFVAYLNGVEVDRRQFTGTPDGDSDAGGSHSDGEAIVFESLDITSHLADLREGNNVLAIHGLNVDADSSDFLMSMELVTGSTPIVTVELSPTAVEYTGPVTLDTATMVKSRVISSGSTWSALNEATFVIGSEGLVVSEIMYDPVPPTEAEIAAEFTNGEDFEYLELFNPGPGTIDLTGLVLDSGITFDFATGAITSLAPGERVLVVENIAAFEFRYGSVHPIAGQYGGKLNNGGELVRLSNILDAPIVEFTYDNLAPWPLEAAGNGSSLVLVDPYSNPDHDDHSSWQASPLAGGTPGLMDVVSPAFSEWGAGYGVSDPDGDDDGDGQSNFMEFVRGTSPMVQTPPWLPDLRFERLEVAGTTDSFWTLSLTYRLTAANVVATPEVSNDLQDWDSGPGFIERYHTVYHGDGTATTKWRSALPIGDSELFLRVRFEGS